MNKTQEKVRDLKILNWVLLGVITVMILSAAGWLFLKNVDNINSELLDSLKNKGTVEESTSSSDNSSVNIDQELQDMDKIMNDSDDQDLVETELADSELGL